ncbi:MAG: hypothetical protein AAF526_04385 [Pseudomonadota bacterium]
MEALLATTMEPVAVPVVALAIGIVVVAAVFYFIGRNVERSRGRPADEALGREMRRMRRENVVLSEERDLLRESVDRERRRSRRGAAAEDTI